MGDPAAGGASVLKHPAGQGNVGEQGSGAGGQGSGGANGGNGSWYATLPEDLRASQDITKYSSLEDFTRAFVHRGTLLGRDKIALPPPNAPESEWDEVWNKLGRPAKPEEYKLTDQAKFPEGYALDPAELKMYSESAHKLGLTPKQAAALLQLHVDTDTARMQRIVEENKKTRQQLETTIRQTWGGQYEANLAFVERIVKTFGGKEQGADLAQKVGSDPALLQFVHAISSKLSEDTLGAGGRSTFMTTPSEAQRKIQAIRSDSKHPYNDGNHPDHQRALEEMRALYDQAYPESAGT